MKSETPQQMADRLKFECDLSHGMDGICYEDENREVLITPSGKKSEVAIQKPILQVKPLTNNKEQKIDSNDRPDIPILSVPFYENIKRK